MNWHFHALEETDHVNPDHRFLLVTVVVGSVATPFIKEPPHVIAMGEPLSFILMRSWSPSTGVPVRFVVMDVIAAASAVISNWSVTFVLIDGVALDVMATTR